MTQADLQRRMAQNKPLASTLNIQANHLIQQTEYTIWYSLIYIYFFCLNYIYISAMFIDSNTCMNGRHYSISHIFGQQMTLHTSDTTLIEWNQRRKKEWTARQIKVYKNERQDTISWTKSYPIVLVVILFFYSSWFIHLHLHKEIVKNELINKMEKND